MHVPSTFAFDGIGDDVYIIMLHGRVQTTNM